MSFYQNVTRQDSDLKVGDSDDSITDNDDTDVAVLYLYDDGWNGDCFSKIFQKGEANKASCKNVSIFYRM